MEGWSVREKLALVSCAQKTGTQNWSQVSKAIKQFEEPNRPSEHFSPKNCSLQYNTLVQSLNAPSPRRRRSDEVSHGDGSSVETQLVEKLRAARIEELQRLIEDTKAEYLQIRSEIRLIESGKVDDKLEQVWEYIERGDDSKASAVLQMAATEIDKEESAAKTSAAKGSHQQQTQAPVPSKASMTTSTAAASNLPSTGVGGGLAAAERRKRNKQHPAVASPSGGAASTPSLKIILPKPPAQLPGPLQTQTSALDMIEPPESSPAPSSVGSLSDVECDEKTSRRQWRKSIMLVWTAARSHKYANVFLNPVTEDIAPGYHTIVKRPMDLSTIKKNVENGVLRSTDEFRRDMSLMFINAMMYNPKEHEVHKMAKEMYDDVMHHITQYALTQHTGGLYSEPKSLRTSRRESVFTEKDDDTPRRRPAPIGDAFDPLASSPSSAASTTTPGFSKRIKR